MDTTGPLSSRRSLLGLAGGAAAAVFLAACGGTKAAIDTTAATAAPSSSAAAASSTSSSAASATTAATTAVTAAAATGSCVLSPEMTEGPYYVAGEPTRRDVTEGKAGTPLALKLTVVDTTCAPIKDATVEIWHADAAGDYSAFGNGASSRTFLRGQQVSAADGVVSFDTIHPGWYQGRATHIHLKVHRGGNTVHTGQLFFDEAVNDAVYATSAYAGHSGSRTRNATDGIYRNGGSSSMLALVKSGSGYAGSITLMVR
jgi:protocatechuate 3,4-dioxygenase beta subunit